MPLPWALRRRALSRCFGYEIAPDARLGFSVVLVGKLVLARHSGIGHLNYIKGADEVRLDASSFIGHLNWITAFPSDSGSGHFKSQPERRPRLHVGEHSAITNRHLIDCTGEVRIGRFTTFAGFRSQVLSHSIDLHLCQQRAQPISIGDYCFVGTGCILLGGAQLPNFSVLGAGSVLNKAFDTPYSLYAGAPSELRKPLSPDMAYFHRTKGFVW